MCNASPNQKAILNTINTYRINDIHNFLEKGFELSCMLRYGINPEKLNGLDLEILKDRINKESITERALADAGMHKSLIDQIFGNETYTPPSQPETAPFGSPTEAPPISDNPKPASAPILDKIIRNKINVSEIQDKLLNEEITEEQLMEQCGLNERLIERIKTYTIHSMPPVEFEELPDLQTDRTDFYFLGLPTAGKSCLIASLLSHWLRTGICNPEVKNQRSIQYFKQLGGGFSSGILPNSTITSFIDYIELTLKLRVSEKSMFGGTKEKTYDIPINILDMAGEKFRKVADEGREKFESHKNYLSNKNPKSIFFVLDYSADKQGDNTFEQSFSLQVVLNNLHEMGILEETDSIYVVVTKADRFPVSIDKYTEYATNYVEENYKAFKNTLNDLSTQFGFGVEVMPYSIGPSIFGQLLEDYNPKTNNNLNIYPESLSNRIIKQTAKFRRGMGGFFTN